MSVLQRAKRIFSRSWEEMCEQSTDPESDLKEALRGMEQTLSDLRRMAAQRITDKKLVERHIEKLQEGQHKWGKNAEKAVGAGQDDLARKALIKKKDIQLEIDKEIIAVNELNGEIEELKREIKQAESKYNEFKTKVRLLKHNAILVKAGIEKSKSSIENIESLELQFKQLEEEVQMRELENDNLEDEFAALKARVKKKKKEN